MSIKKLSTYFATGIFLIFGLVGCTEDKPGVEDIKKSFTMSLKALQTAGGADLSNYLEVVDAQIDNSYEDKGVYVIEATPKIHIKKSLDQSTVASHEFQYAHISQTVKLIESIKLYSMGQYNMQQLQMAMNIRTGPQGGILSTGDAFNGLKSEYKFRKSDQGWMPID